MYRQVLNLHVQVGPYLETPPWLRPIALFLIKLRTLLVGIGSKREGDITNKEGLISYTILQSAMVDIN